mmetsp:Transcript_4476/g.10855  ORF Transcript_4476/g.10855 Transcript_4476/m.10855 type:complete len:259 (-) Transcript_4476:679-1455(-)
MRECLVNHRRLRIRLRFRGSRCLCCVSSLRCIGRSLSVLLLFLSSRRVFCLLRLRSRILGRLSCCFRHRRILRRRILRRLCHSFLSLISHSSFSISCSCITRLGLGVGLWRRQKPQVRIAGAFRLDSHALQLNPCPSYQAPDVFLRDALCNIVDLYQRQRSPCLWDVHEEPLLKPQLSEAFAGLVCAHNRCQYRRRDCGRLDWCKFWGSNWSWSSWEAALLGFIRLLLCISLWRIDASNCSFASRLLGGFHRRCFSSL